MTELDCTDVDTALWSLSRILDRSIGDLTDVLSRFTGATDTDEEKTKYPFESRLLLGTVSRSREQLPFADSIIWFHATRVPLNTQYQDGLLPTCKARPKIRQLLSTIATGEGICTPAEWIELEAKADRASNKVAKIKSSPDMGHDAGPHGFLPRDYIIEQMPSYIECPEELGEFCSRIENGQGNQLLKAYKDQTRSAIVKFRSSTRVNCAVSTAIEYIHWKLIGDKLSLSKCPSCGWDGRGISVPKSDILDIEWIDVSLPS